MLGAIILIIIVAWLLSDYDTNPTSTNQPNVSTNTVVIPNDIVCPNCKNKEFKPMRDLDVGTFDMICPKCKEVAWENPKRQDRIDMLDYLFDQTRENNS